ncbi:hypothetical protein D3C85_1314530 [compost metagenome]
MRLFRLAAEIGQLREGVPGHHQVGIGLVVAEQDVVLGGQRLDQVVFQDQRFRLAAHHGGVDGGDLAHHQLDARTVVRLLEVGADALLQVDGLADVQHVAVGIEHAVHPRQARQIGQEGLGVEGRQFSCHTRS